LQYWLYIGLLTNPKVLSIAFKVNSCYGEQYFLLQNGDLKLLDMNSHSFYL